MPIDKKTQTIKSIQIRLNDIEQAIATLKLEQQEASTKPYLATVYIRLFALEVMLQENKIKEGLDKIEIDSIIESKLKQQPLYF